MEGQDWAALLVLAALWGGSFLFIRVASPALGPVVLAAVRVLVAGGALLLYASAIGRRPNLLARWKHYATLGALNAAVPFTLISAAELHLTASLAAILNATTPLFAALVSAIWLRERLTARKGLGLGLGLAGVAVLVGWSPLPLGPAIVASVGASLLGAASYALAGVYAKVTFAGTPPLALAIGQQLGAGVLLLPLALPAAAVGAPWSHLSAGVILAALALALASTSVAYLLYFRLIARVGPTNTLSVTFLVPLFGLLWSALFLHEAISGFTLLGLAIILSSVGLVTGARLRRPAGVSALPR